MHNSDGEAFDGVGHLYACNLAYCQNCVSLKARVHRRRVRATLKHLKPLVGTSWNFVTLTAPTVAAPLLESIQVYLRAWDLLRKRKWFVDSVRAGWKGIEFTVNKETGLAHVHIHALMLSKFLRPSDVRATWQDCITRAWSERGVSLEFGASGAVIDVRPITARNNQALESAILEVCKYAGKGSAWLALSDADLLAVSQLKRFNRLFESFGESYGNQSEKTERNIRLDTHILTDGEKLKTVKTKVINDLSTLDLKVNVCRSWRKAQLTARYPVAVFRTLDGRDFLPTERREPREPLRLIKPNGVKSMNVRELLFDEVATLSDELKDTERLMREAARRNDETALMSLQTRRSQLPTLIHEAKMKTFADNLSQARSRIAGVDTELQTAVSHVQTLGEEIEPKIQALHAEIERLRREFAEAVANKDSLLGSSIQAHAELARLHKQRETLLLATYGT
jgi:hypothetical protein